jgi:hypothetical protein
MSWPREHHEARRDQEVGMLEASVATSLDTTNMHTKIKFQGHSTRFNRQTPDDFGDS